MGFHSQHAESKRNILQFVPLRGAEQQTVFILI